MLFRSCAMELQQAFGVYLHGELSLINDIHWIFSQENKMTILPDEQHGEYSYMEAWESQTYSSDRNEFIRILSELHSKQLDIDPDKLADWISDALDVHFASLKERNNLSNGESGRISLLTRRLFRVGRRLLPFSLLFGLGRLREVVNRRVFHQLKGYRYVIARNLALVLDSEGLICSPDTTKQICSIDNLVREFHNLSRETED